MWYLSESVQQAFKKNLQDWCDHNLMQAPQVRLGCYEQKIITVDNALAKNHEQTLKWHIRFLQDHSEYEKTDYWNEYLLPLYSDPLSRAESYLKLLQEVKQNGIKRPIWVADIVELNLGFRYFRFDGCHRTCIARHLGLEKVEALVFKVL